MAKKSTSERRDRLRLSLIEIAERTVAASGVTALTARELAREAGCSVGAIYTIFPDMNALVDEVNARTLTALEAAVVDAFARGEAATSPKRALSVLGQTYFEFVLAHEKRWSAVFEQGFQQARTVPQWQLDEHMRLIGHIVRPLRALLPEAGPERLGLLAKSLFSAVHGIVSLGLQRRFLAVPPAEITAQIAFIVEAFADGVVARGDAGAPAPKPRS